MQEFVLLPSIMEGFQNPIPFMSKTPPSHISQTKTWCGHLGYAMEGKIKRPFNFLMFHMFASRNFWKVNKGIEHPCGKECLQKLSKPNRCQATNYQKPPHAYMVNIYGINLFNYLYSYTKDVIIYLLKVFWSRYQCGYGLEDYQEKLNPPSIY